MGCPLATILPLRDSAGLVIKVTGFPHCAPRFRASGAPLPSLFGCVGEYSSWRVHCQTRRWVDWVCIWVLKKRTLYARVCDAHRLHGSLARLRSSRLTVYFREMA
jgi:hypothetical protein